MGPYGFLEGNERFRIVSSMDEGSTFTSREEHLSTFDTARTKDGLFELGFLRQGSIIC